MNKLKSMSTSNLMKYAIILITLPILAFILYSLYFQPSSDSMVCMGSEDTSNLSYLIIIAILLILAYSIYRIIKNRRSTELEANANNIKNESITTFSDRQQNDTTIPETGSNESYGKKEQSTGSTGIVEMVRKLLNKDDLKVMEIILQNEGITQDSLYSLTGFSRSKLSMIIKDLEEKDLIEREKSGRTFKIYLSSWAKSQNPH